MANGTAVQPTGLLGTSPQNFQGLLADPIFNLGLGLLSAGLSQPRSFGQALAQGLQLGGSLQQQQAQNQLLRERMQAEARQARARQQIAETMQQGRPATPGMVGAAPGTTRPAGLLDVPLQTLFEAFPEQFGQGLLSQVFATRDPTSLQRNFEFLTGLGFSQEQALDALRTGTTVNVGAQDKPLSVSDLTKLRLPSGETPPIGTTPAQALEMGARVLTNEQQKALEASEKFTGILDELETLALGEGGVFTDIQPGLANRAKAGLDLFIGSVTRERPNIEAYQSLAQGTIAPFIRLLGESGALAEGDVARGLGLLPQIRDEFLLPDTREDARNKLDALRGILERGLTKLRDQTTGGQSSASRASGSSSARRTGRVIDFSDLPE